MSQLDRAFVKAYARRHIPVATPSGVAAPHLSLDLAVAPPPQPLTVEFAKIQAAVAWSPLPDESYFRVDIGHSQAAQAFAPRSRAVAVAMPETATPTVPAPTAPVERLEPQSLAMPEADPEAVMMRVDAGHQQSTWTPPASEEVQDHHRQQQEAELAAEFAKAKAESLSEPSSAQVATAVSTPPTPAAARQRKFEPVWEVDAFEFSDTVVALFGDAKLMRSIGEPLDRAVANGLRSLLITSSQRAAGRTSIAVGIAVSAAAAGLRVVLVDADTTSPAIARTLQIEFQQGWVEAIRRDLPLDEVAVRSIEDQLTVIPALTDAGNLPYTSAEFDKLMSKLREAFDLVIVDGAPWAGDCRALQRSSSLDAAIIVVDARSQDDNQIRQLQDDLRHCGVAGLGIVENFV